MNSVDALLGRLEQLNSIGVSLSKERDLSSLLENILLAAKSITHSDGGTFYRTVNEGLALRAEILRNDSLNICMGGPGGKPIVFPDLPLTQANGQPNDALVAAYCAIHKETVNIADAYDTSQFDFSGTRQFDARTGYRSQSFLAVPMKDHDGSVIGVLQLINAIDPASGKVRPFSQADQSLAESLASQAAIAITNRNLMQQMETLFESFISLINVAIDEKSPYTAGHCDRVPALTMMLAEAANAVQTGPLQSFTMDARDIYELKIAGLLHDCGKVTTPVHVVDKQSKLQTLFDRISMVDTRFEVLKRDREIAALKAQLALREVRDSAAEQALSDELQNQLVEINSERDFLRQTNRGAEFMQSADLERVQRIAQQYQWTNPDGQIVPFLDADELENLTIRAGTLNAKERDIINYHIVATIKMLDQLPWPRHLKNVPEYAGGHHERMDGKGYPKGLTREQMSVQARIMGIADIFEALTARDRPYKKGMTLSEAMRIMHKFKMNGHIDPDLFDVFLSEKVYLRYAQQHLEPWQIDEVNPEQW
jgi:HD-GYP domain-containing protein (c-di-GMP phosphodiesterase class II)